MGKSLSCHSQGETTSQRFVLVEYFTHDLVISCQRYVAVKNWESQVEVQRPQAERPGVLVSSQALEQEDDATPQLGTSLTRTQALEDILSQQQLPLTLPRFLCPNRSVDQDLEQIRDSHISDKPDNFPQDKRRVTWSWKPRPSAFHPVVRYGPAISYLPRPGKLELRNIRREDDCLELCSVCTRVHGRPMSIAPVLDLKWKEDDAVPEPCSGQRGLVYSPSVQETLGHSSMTQRGLGNAKATQGVVGQSKMGRRRRSETFHLIPKIP